MWPGVHELLKAAKEHWTSIDVIPHALKSCQLISKADLT